jgi:hypothetical protein
MAKVRLAVGIIWLLSLLSPMSQTTPALADQVTAKWLRVNTPTEGTAGNWVLANGSDALHLTMAIDGTLYAYGKSLTYTLYKSTDSGYSWSSTGKVTDAIVGIAAAPDDAGVIYYATTANVYKSTNAGDSFASLPPNPGGAGSNNVEITSIAAAEDGTVAVGTRDTDPHDYGDVYTLKESESFTWVDTNIGDYDVYTVAYPPISSQLVAVATDGDDTIVSSNIGDAGWGNTIGDVTITDLEPASASLAFPNDYHPDVTAGANILFMGIDSDGGLKGDVYKITNMTAPNSSVATDLNIGIAYGLDKVDVTSVAISGEAANARLLAGVADSVQVYFSTDSGSHWTISSKPPTGESKTYVLMAPDFASSGRAYAATSEAESAVSYTVDGGLTWNQVSLIDTTITTILDLAPSPDYSQDNTLFMLTWGAAYGLWQSLNGGARWERVFSSALTSVDSLNLVELPPQYGADNQIVLLAGESNSNPVIWKSTDNGQTFLSPLTTKDPATGATFSINTWAIVDDTTLFIGSFDGSSGQVYHTTNSGLSYSTPAVVGSQSLNSIVLSPTYEQDETILIGNTNGWIYWSKDNGDSFEPLPPGAASAPLTGSVTVAFDSQFSSNNTVYAASDTADKGIYRFIIGIRTTWESIDSTLATGGMLKQLVSADGTLYATNFNGDGGMERCLNPTYPLGPTFEAATNGLDSDATLNGLWLGDNRLWAVDTTNIRLMTYIDSLTIPVTLTSPTDKVPGIGTIINYTINDVSLDWEALTGATNYSWQLNYITDFSTIPTDFEGTTRASSVHLPTLAPATTYYWRVRATQPVVSPWSAKWSFTTSLGDAAIAPKLASPEAGATGVALKPIFQWETVAGADSYELIVSTDINFNNPTISKCDDYALPGTAWQANPALEPNTTYYWKVRAISSGTHSAWSAVGAFITESPTELLVSPAPQAPPASSPSVLPQLITSNWLLYLIGALLVTIVLLIITLLIVIIRLSRI